MRTITIALLVGSAACSSSPPAAPASSEPAPTYSELFATYFAPGTPGHCATAGCHADPGHNEWLCGTTKDACYQGMVEVGLIDPAHPQQSSIADPSQSPLVWFNPAGGNMPFDAQQVPDQAAHDTIAAWVAAGAKND